MSEAATGALQFNTTPDERTMGLVCGLLAAFTGFIGPLVIFIIKKDSLFVKMCALQALLWHLGFMVISGGTMMLFVFGMVFSTAIQVGHHTGGPPLFMFAFPFVWLIMMLGWIVNLTLGLLSGCKANEGIWWPYPIAGRLARKFLGVAV